LERGEMGVLAVQFGALVIVLLVLSNFASGVSVVSTPTITTVYWGAPSSNIQLAKAATNVESANANTMSVFYSLAVSTTPASVTAGRLCLDSDANDTGGTYTYTDIMFNYSSSHHSNYISFGPTDQTVGQTCTYSVQLTDSLQQTYLWVSTVQLKAPSAAN
jgi:hypothetical protein